MKSNNREILEYLNSGLFFEKKDAKQLLLEITKGLYNDSEISYILSIYNTRGISLSELEGFQEALWEECKKIHIENNQAIDLCGTGGDGKDTFNISTLCAFVVAGAGYQVLKHGNYGSSSVCGSSNLLESLGYSFLKEQEDIQKQLEKYNICFLHAPFFHPAMKFVANVRKSLPVRTFFNSLGPLLNPTSVQSQIIGVSNQEILRLYKYYFEKRNIDYTLIYSYDGCDEISLCEDFRLISSEKDCVVKIEDLPVKKVQKLDLIQTQKQAKKIFLDVLTKQGNKEQNDIIITNSAFAISCINSKNSIEDCFEEAKESLFSQRAYNIMKQLVQ